MIKYKALCLAFTFHGPHMAKWTSWNGKSTLIALTKGFLVFFTAKQYSYIDKFTLVS